MHRLRVYWIVLKGLITEARIKPDWTKPFSLYYRIGPWDVEVTRAFTTTYSSFMTLARWQFSCSMIGVVKLIRNGWVPLTYSEHVRFKRSLKLFDRVEIITSVLHVDDRMVYFRHLFKTKEGLAAVGYSCGSFYQKTRFVDVKSLFSEIPQFMSDPKPESQSWQDFDKEINSTIEDLKNCHDQRT